MADDTTTTETQSARRTHRGLNYSILFSIQDLDKVIAELSLHRPQDLALLALEGGLLKLQGHFALAKPAQVAAVFAGRAQRVFASHLGKVFLPRGQLFCNLYCFLFRLAQNVCGMYFFYH